MLIPFPDPRTGGVMRHARVKVFPALRDAEGHRVKYLQPRGSAPRPFFPLATLGEALEGTAPLWLVEGEKKALAVAQLGLPAVGFCGIEGWHAARSRELLVDFDVIRLAGRIIELAPDGDWRVNANVERGVRRLAEALERRGGARPSGGAAAPGGGVTKVGVDDLLVAGASASDLAALPRVEWWPSLAPEALHGLAGRVVETVTPYTEADPVAILAHLLVGIGNLIGPGPHAVVGRERHPLRLYAALVGQSSKARKGTAWATPRYLLGEVDEAWRLSRVRTGLSSGEGVIYHVRDARAEQQPVKERGRVVTYESVTVDAGELDKRLLVIESELAVVLKRMAREGNSLSGVIRDAWDTGDLSTLTKNSPLRATGAHLSIVAHITEPELHRHLTETECANGFANRFLWFLVRRSKLLPDGPSVPEPELAPLVNALRDVVRLAGTVGELARDEEATAVWRDIYGKLTREEPGMVGAIIGRAEAQVLRIFGDRLGDHVSEAILDALRSQGPLALTGLHASFGRHRSPAELAAALSRLEATGRTARRTLRETGGRPAEVWEAIG